MELVFTLIWKAFWLVMGSFALQWAFGQVVEHEVAFWPVFVVAVWCAK